MKKRLFTVCIGILSAWTGVCFAQSNPGNLTAHQLRTEYLVNPVGIDETSPRLSWQLSSPLNAEKQTAYRVLVASSLDALRQDRGDLWDSGKILSDQTLHVVYDGQNLTSRMEVWWKVMVWDKEGKPSAWSEPAQWSMGLLQERDWQAQWIADSTAMKTEIELIPKIDGFCSLVAHRADTTQRVTIDLGASKTFDTIKLFPARPFDYRADVPGFLFPVRFRIEVADQEDFSDLRTIADYTRTDIPNPGVEPQSYPVPATTARFVRLTVTRLALRDGDNYGFALAEMQVLSGGKNLAEKASVLSDDAIKRWNWNPFYLTDGILRSTPLGLEMYGALPATYARKTFSLPKPVKKATLYVTAKGLYEFRINGQKLGNQRLAPEWTDYHKRISYQTYDITPWVQTGENAAAATLAEGWYAGELWASGRFTYGKYPELLAQIEVEFADGTRQVIPTDASWKTTTQGPVTAAGIYRGEMYDARLELSGWDRPGFDDSRWTPAGAFMPNSLRLISLRNEPIRVEQEIRPQSITEPKPGVYVIDFGQNLVGCCHFKLKGKAGKTVTFRHAEAVYDDGTLYTISIRLAPQIDQYTPARDGEFEYEPTFTYHGFRYAEVSGVEEAPTLDDVVARVFHSSAPFTGTFACSNDSLNQLMSNILWTQRSNLMSTPNDCPQRDERMGWMGDIQAFGQTAIFNMDLAAFITKFAQDMRDGQADDGRFPDYAPHPGGANDFRKGAPAWGDCGVMLPWTAYINYADRRLLEEQFAAAKAWVDYIARNNPDLIWRNGRNSDYSDWMNGDEIITPGWPRKGAEVPKEVFATAFFARSTQIVARMAEEIGYPLEADRYRQLAEAIKKAFNQAFVEPDGHILGDTQAGYAIALNFDLLPEELRAKAAALMVDNIQNKYQGRLSTGIQTSHRMMMELVREGYADVAWQLMTSRAFPSWLYMVDNGATTIWERWDGYVKGRGFYQESNTNSMNHWAFGSVGEWMWRYIAGLNPDEAHPGWEHFFITPIPGGNVTWAKADYESIRGKISSHWKIEKGKFRLDVEIPVGTSATVSLPSDRATGITLNGKKVEPIAFDHRTATLELESGIYQLVAPFRQE